MRLAEAVTNPELTPDSAEPVTGRRSERILGIDMARGIALALMVIVHFVAWWEGEGALFTGAELISGRAMPLFMLLGGVGVTLMASRSRTPARNLLIRAVLLMALGLVLTRYIDRLAIVLQAYALFFVLAIGLRKLHSIVLLGLVAALVAVGAVTYQIVGTPRDPTTFDTLFTSSQGVESLVFDGFYPLFPVGAFFVFGLWLARLDLRSDRVAAALLSCGAVVGLGVWIGASEIVSTFDVQVDFGGRAGDGSFHWSRLLDGAGHSAMPAWTISALGTSAAMLGLSLLVAPRLPSIVRPFTVVGSMSLSFYVFQAWVTNVVPNTSETEVLVEWAMALSVFVVFFTFAEVWRRWFRTGPLERLLRVGSGSRLPN